MQERGFNASGILVYLFSQVFSLHHSFFLLGYLLVDSRGFFSPYSHILSYAAVFNASSVVQRL